ncbi:hypothetical protein [Kribbella lupini]|uniref:Uncharacterized protein n=1 Tax=Kribbella lupini TaxID=291602 RepID=A0ABP4N6Y9_9ACTN
MIPTRNRTRLAAVLTRRRSPAAPKQEAATCPGGETRPEPATPEPESERRQTPSYSLIGW